MSSKAATATNTNSELVLSAPSLAEFTGWANLAGGVEPARADVELGILAAGGERAVKVTIPLEPGTASGEERARWRMMKA
jgi:hypothetical protein